LYRVFKDIPRASAARVLFPCFSCNTLSMCFFSTLERKRARVSHGKNFTSCKDLGAFLDDISGAAITMKYNQISAELTQNKKLWDKITNLKKQLFNFQDVMTQTSLFGISAA
jgi:hypothetical protein